MPSACCARPARSRRWWRTARAPHERRSSADPPPDPCDRRGHRPSTSTARSHTLGEHPGGPAQQSAMNVAVGPRRVRSDRVHHMTVSANDARRARAHRPAVARRRHGSNDPRGAAGDQVGRRTRDLTQPPDDPQRRRHHGGQDSCADTEAGTAVGIAQGRDRRRESSAGTVSRVGLVVSVGCRGLRHRASVASTTRGDDGRYERFASPKSERVLAPRSGNGSAVSGPSSFPPHRTRPDTVGAS